MPGGQGLAKKKGHGTRWQPLPPGGAVVDLWARGLHGGDPRVAGLLDFRLFASPLDAAKDAAKSDEELRATPKKKAPMPAPMKAQAEQYAYYYYGEDDAS